MVRGDWWTEYCCSTLRRQSRGWMASDLHCIVLVTLRLGAGTLHRQQWVVWWKLNCRWSMLVAASWHEGHKNLSRWNLSIGNQLLFPLPCTGRLYLFISSNEPSINALTEAWLTSSVDDAEISFVYYSTFRADRVQNRRGSPETLHIKLSLRTVRL